MSVSPALHRDPTLLGGEGQADTACFVHGAAEEAPLSKAVTTPGRGFASWARVMRKSQTVPRRTT